MDQEGKTYEWPNEDILRSKKPRLDDAEWEELLATPWAEEFLENLEKRRPGFVNFCVAIICDGQKAKDRQGRVDAPFLRKCVCKNALRTSWKKRPLQSSCSTIKSGGFL